MFRKMIAAMALTLAAVGSYAGQTVVDTSGLSDAQVAELKAIAAKKVAETAASAKSGSEVTPEKVTAGVTLAATWGTQAAAAAEGFAKAMGIAARELNLTINDFLKSPAGMLTAALIVWKMAGAAILHALYGVVFLTIGLCMVRVIYVRLFTKEMVRLPYSSFFGMFKGERLVRVPKNFADLRNDGEWMAFWIMIILTIVTLVCAGTFF